MFPAVLESVVWYSLQMKLTPVTISIDPFVPATEQLFWFNLLVISPTARLKFEITACVHSKNGLLDLNGQKAV